MKLELLNRARETEQEMRYLPLYPTTLICRNGYSGYGRSELFEPDGSPGTQWRVRKRRAHHLSKTKRHLVCRFGSHHGRN